MSWSIPDEPIQKDCVMKAIYGIKAGGDKQSNEELLFTAGKNVEHKGAEVIVLGCTEIPLAFNPQRASVPVINATRLLAEAAIREYFREEKKNWMPERPAVEPLGHQAVGNRRLAGQKQPADARGILLRIVKGRTVDKSLRIEDHNVGHATQAQVARSGNRRMSAGRPVGCESPGPAEHPLAERVKADFPGERAETPRVGHDAGLRTSVLPSDAVATQGIVIA